MKKLLFLATVIILAQINLTKGQCIADAGPDVVVCCDWNGVDTIQIGGNPTASGGVPPYTYIWETECQLGYWNFTASDFLNDTTIANPSVENTAEELTFYLTVIDSESNICRDSVHVGFTNFGMHLGTMSITIQQGDSVYLSGWINVFGGYPPFEYLWRPNEGLTDSTSGSFWAKPSYSVAYYVTLTDSSGCSITGSPVYYVNVIPNATGELERENSEINVYPNPSNKLITIDVKENYSGEKTIEFIDGKGQVIWKKVMEGNSLQVDSKLLNKGINFYRITSSGKLIGQGKILIE